VECIVRLGGEDYADTVIRKPYYAGDYAYLVMLQPQFKFARTRGYAKIESPGNVVNEFIRNLATRVVRILLPSELAPLERSPPDSPTGVD
jgi:hypothetical protein